MRRLAVALALTFAASAHAAAPVARGVTSWKTGRSVGGSLKLTKPKDKQSETTSALVKLRPATPQQKN